MKPRRYRSGPPAVPGRRQFLRSAASLMVAGSSVWSGCQGLSLRPQSPDKGEAKGTEVKLVGDLAIPVGMHPVKIESVALVTQLPGTGSDPPPGPERSILLDEMQKRGVIRPNQVLASPTTELVVVRGFLRPGIQKGDHFDLELRVPSRSECTSLRGGWLMETRLKELAVTGAQLGGSRIREGKVLALAQGPIMVDPSASSKVEQTRGRVLGGGIALESRLLGLAVKPDFHKSVATAQIGTAINRRFSTFASGVKEGVANPKDDKFVELVVHPRYKDNIDRYIQVIRSLPLRETAGDHERRLGLLERQLLDPISSAAAALKLEAVGKDGVPILKRGLTAREAEVRFYAAEALAYLDESDATAPLAAAARDVPAFRAYALAALSAMDDYGAYEALRDLLPMPSAETRYGAFRALWAMNARDTLVRGEELGGQFSYHVLSCGGPDMIHVTRSYRPEVVLFGSEQRFITPLVLEAGPNILINAPHGDQVTISRFQVGNSDQKRVVSTRVDDVIRAVVDLGGTYPDVVQALQKAKTTAALTCRLEVDALPQGGRTYDRDGARKQDGEPSEDQSAARIDPAIASAGGAAGDSATDGKAESGRPQVVVGTPAPGLFGARPPRSETTALVPAKSSADKEKDQPPRPFLGRIFGR